MMRARRFPRRALLGAAAAGAALALFRLRPAAAGTPDVEAAIRTILNGRTPDPGGIALAIPILADNGNAVPMTVTVDSAMTATDRVLGIHVFAESNPLPIVVAVAFGPAAAQATFTTRIRLATSQRVSALAAMQDGSFRIAHASVEITLAACLDE
jgi:sulfur-oxidizing protein SoxY